MLLLVFEATLVVCVHDGVFSFLLSLLPILTELSSGIIQTLTQAAHIIRQVREYVWQKMTEKEKKQVLEKNAGNGRRKLRRHLWDGNRIPQMDVTTHNLIFLFVGSLGCCLFESNNQGLKVFGLSFVFESHSSISNSEWYTDPKEHILCFSL